MSVRDKIAQSSDLAHEDVQVPEWEGVTVRLSSVSLARREELRKSFVKRGDDDDIVESCAELLAATLRDPESNELVFTSIEDARDVLSARDSTVVERLVAVANRVLGLDSDAREQIEGAKKSPSAE